MTNVTPLVISAEGRRDGTVTSPSPGRHQALKLDSSSSSSSSSSCCSPPVVSSRATTADSELVTCRHHADVMRSSSLSPSEPSSAINFSINRILDRPYTSHSQSWKLSSDDKAFVDDDECLRGTDSDSDGNDKMNRSHPVRDESTHKSKLHGIHQQMAPVPFPPGWLLFGGLLVQPLHECLSQGRRYNCSSQLAKLATEGSYQTQQNGW